MSKKEKLGIGVIVAILGFLGLVYALTTTRPQSSTGDFVNNPITQRRVDILQDR